MDFMKLPKIELHCHLDGSVRPQTVIDIAKQENISLPSFDVEVIKEKMGVSAGCTSLNEYLKCFDLPIKVMQSKESLIRISYELLEDAAKEGTRYIEVRFGPLLHMQKRLTIEEVIESVREGMLLAEKQYDIKGNIILSCLRNMPVESVDEVIEAGRKFLGKGVVAIDLCANEEKGFAKDYVDAFARARAYGYKVTIHAGETGCGENVLEAVELLGAKRIGHGVSINNCQAAYDLVKKKGITLEMCPVSNVQTRAVETLEKHPIMLFHRNGVKVTVNTDNRTVSNTTLINEYKRVDESFKLSDEEYKRFYENAVEAAFADKTTKSQLVKELNKK